MSGVREGFWRRSLGSGRASWRRRKKSAARDRGGMSSSQPDGVGEERGGNVTGCGASSRQGEATKRGVRGSEEIPRGWDAGPD